jgi:hypothetical protein
MRLSQIAALFLCAIVAGLGCSKSSSPATPDSTDSTGYCREAQGFEDAIPIFGTDPPDPLEPPHYHNIDLGHIYIG